MKVSLRRWTLIRIALLPCLPCFAPCSTPCSCAPDSRSGQCAYAAASRRGQSGRFIRDVLLAGHARTRRAAMSVRALGLDRKTLWDLGSHFGLFAVGWVAGRPTGAVAAFEPNPVCYDRLTLHVRRNRLPWVRTFPLACPTTPARTVSRVRGLPRNRLRPSAL